LKNTKKLSKKAKKLKLKIKTDFEEVLEYKNKSIMEFQ
jgi:hypothetical protein